jgi:5-methylcytosine-specific restriction endonuclease McrA
VTLSPQVAALFQPYVVPAGADAKPPKRKNPTKEGSLMCRMLAAQGDVCGICGIKLRRNPSFDHVVPRCRGGGNVGNRIIAHVPCNFRKGDRMPTGCELVMLAAVNARLAA